MFELISNPRRRTKSRPDLTPDFITDFMGLNNVGYRTDIKEDEGSYVIQTELPGLSREDIDIKVRDNRLTISAANENVIEEAEDNYIRKERRSGSYYRTFNLRNVKTDEINAKYENGLLEVTLPKTESAEEQGRRIDIH
ncbi:hypothetical protein JCM16358_24010 [Halanaerocella petrolearia]